MQGIRLIDQTRFDLARLEDSVFDDVKRMVYEFGQTPANREVYWLSLYGDAVGARLILHLFTERDWRRLRHSPAYREWTDDAATAPFDGPRWSPGDCARFLDDWSEETERLLVTVRRDPLAELTGTGRDDDEELELWDLFDDMLVSVVNRLGASDAMHAIDVTSDFFAATSGHDESPDEAARRARRNIAPETFYRLFPAECSLPPWVEVTDHSPSEELHFLLELARRLVVDPATAVRWSRHSPLLTGLEDALVELGRRWPPTLAALEWSDLAGGRHWPIASAFLSASIRIRHSEDPVLNGW